jgi:hypothetical protein
MNIILAELYNPLLRGSEGPISTGKTLALIQLTNWGDAPADVNVSIYYINSPNKNIMESLFQLHQVSFVVPAKETDYQMVRGPVVPSYLAPDGSPIWVKITTSSKYVIPNIEYYCNVTGDIWYPSFNGELAAEYFPGDFQKVEIYS